MRSFHRPFVLTILALGTIGAIPAWAQPSQSLVFEHDGAVLDDTGRQVLRAYAQSVSGVADLRISLRGYADSRGDSAANGPVSLRRARAAQSYLMILGLGAEVFTSVEGRGASDPVARNTTEAGRRLNRRVEIWRGQTPVYLDAFLDASPAPDVLAALPTATTVTPVSLNGVSPVATEGAPLLVSPVAVENAPFAVSPVVTVSTPLAARPVATPANATVPPAPASPRDKAFALGIGYPDVRARYAVGSRVDLEAKIALDDVSQSYSGRAYANIFSLGRLNLDLGAELGYVSFSQAAGLAGDGYFGEPFAGLSYRLGQRWRISADLGPAWINLTSQGQSSGDWQWIYNTALYFYLF